MPLVFTAITPHPPIIIPTIGKNELSKVKKTISAFKALSKDFIQANPDTAIIISPHAPLLPNSFAVSSAKTLSGNFSNFSEFETSLKFENDTDLIKKITDESQKSEIPVDSMDNSNIDHGALVPLYYLVKDLKKLKIVLLSFSYLGPQDHFKYGKIIKRAIDSRTDKKVAVIASGDLSHRLTKDAPAGYSPLGKEFDNQLIELLKERNTEKILNLDPEFIEEAGECGLRSTIILLGILDGLEYNVKVLSYEGPFGVGYLVARFEH
jgi:AmmeMemoRadiSam system protein B